MADNSKIEWTDATWTPVKGCTRVSPGCGGPGPHGGCYAEIMAARFSKPGQWGEGLALIVESAGGKKDHRWTGVVRFDANELLKPLHWQRPRRIFVCSTSDLFHEKVEDEWIDQVFAVMALCPQHIFQVLTKRPERMRAYFDDPFLSGRLVLAAMKVKPNDYVESDISIAAIGLPLPNVWLGASVEDQQRADERIPHLLATPAAVRWLSCEPLLGPVDLMAIKAPRYPDEPEDSLDIDWRFDALTTGDYYWFDCGDGYNHSGDGPYREHRIDWVVLGGESGAGARPMHPDWARSVRDQCGAAVLQGDDAPVPFFFKQWGEWVSVSEQAGPGAHHHFADGATVRRVGKKAAGRLLDGVEHNAMPEFRHD